MNFEPFDEAVPDDGVEIEIRVLNADYEAELAAHQAERVQNPFAEGTVFPDHPPALTLSSSDIADGNDICVEAPDLWLVVGYPFEGQYAVEIPAPLPAGFTRRSLFESIVAVHASNVRGRFRG